MRAFSGWLYDHRKIVVAVWLVILVAFLGAAKTVGADYKFDINLSSSESVQAFELLNAHQDGPEGDTVQIVWKAPNGITDPAAKAHAEEVLNKIAKLPNVVAVASPFDASPVAAMQIAPSGTIAYATVQLDQDSLHIPKASVVALVNAIKAGNGDGVTMAASGQSIANRVEQTGTPSEGIGMAAAAVILILAFGSVIAAGLPLLGALLALGLSLSTVTLLTHVLSIPIFAPQLVALIGIGVGIDYALFVVSRHRSGLMQGHSPRDAMLDSMDTSGRAVLFAGITVMISILGLFVAGIGFLNGLAIAASIGVLFTMVVTITLMPAMLGFLGLRVLGRKARRDLEENGPHDIDRSTRWGQWATAIQRRPWPFIVVSVVMLLVLMVPMFSMRLGSADAGVDRIGTTTRTAYDLVAEGFGPGTNGPLLLVTEVGQADALKPVASTVASLPNVVVVTPPMTTADGKVGFMTVIPKTAPQAAETQQLITDLRDNVLPNGTTARIYVSGTTAVFIDFAADLQSKLPWFLVGVLGLSSLLLMLAFRSIAIPVKAALMNLLAAGAAFGVLTAIFQWGWLQGPLGISGTGPIDAFLPIMMLAILFGLSMDYQVFLVSRMREEWVLTGDNATSVRLGLSETGRVITAAALIMISVFAAFVFGGDRTIQMFGVGLASAIFIDAFIIRSLLVPALMQVLGKWNWWIPAWLDRVLPRISIEPTLDEIQHEAELQAHAVETGEPIER